MDEISRLDRVSLSFPVDEHRSPGFAPVDRTDDSESCWSVLLLQVGAATEAPTSRHRHIPIHSRHPDRIGSV